MKNEVMMDQLTLIHKPNKKNEESKNDGPTQFSNETYYYFSYQFLAPIV